MAKICVDKRREEGKRDTESCSQVEDIRLDFESSSIHSRCKLFSLDYKIASHGVKICLRRPFKKLQRSTIYIEHMICDFFHPNAKPSIHQETKVTTVH